MITPTNDIFFMTEAMNMAKEGLMLGEVPIGAVVTYDNKIIGRGFNQNIKNSDPTAHAEIIALREASSYLNNYRLNGCNLYVTIEPCLMCFGACIHSRLNRLIFGADDPKTGATKAYFDLLNSSSLNHKFKVTSGVLAKEASLLITDFFREKRSKN